jgi:hypothetical protein
MPQAPIDYYKYDLQVAEMLRDGFTHAQIVAKILKTTANRQEDTIVRGFRRFIARHQKRLLDEHEGIAKACDDIDIPLSSARHLWLEVKDKNGKKRGNVFASNPDYKKPEPKEEVDFRQALLKDIQEYVPKFPKIKRVKSSDSHLLVLDPADIHIGKLCTAFEAGESYNNQIAVKRVLEGLEGILQKVSSFDIDKILFIGGNDILHIDNPKRTTTSGTPQDTDGMWHTNFLIAKKLYVEVLEILLGVADVRFTFNPSNHDYTNGFFLAQIVETYFKDCKNIDFDCSIAHRKGFKYHNNLIGTTHGDGAKISDLPLLMAQEFSKEWAETKHRYVYTHHVHHKTSKDFIGVTVESLRSPSGTDSWHHRNGFQHAPKAVEGFLHCKENGQIARITHIF